MDETVSRPVDQLKRLVGLGALLAAPALWAQSLLDPTRPPAELYRAAPDAIESGVPQLQSVLIAKGGRQIAVIDGQTVRVGEQFRGAKVTQMTHDSVTLLRAGQRQVLRLPGAATVPAQPWSSAPSTGTP